MSSVRKAHPCEQCSKSFSSTHQLAQHMRIHTGEKPYKCSYCDKAFKQLSHVQQHTRLHTGERPYKCPVAECGRAFIQLSNLQQHMRNHVSSQEKQSNHASKAHLCSDCGKGFKAVANLLTHKCKASSVASRTSKNASSEPCPVCQELYSSKETLVEHLRHHHYTGDATATNSQRQRQKTDDIHQSAACPVCSNVYINQSSLEKHMESHALCLSMAGTSQVQPWSCCVCKTSFSSHEALLCHMEERRTDAKHQFEAQIVLSCAAAGKRSKDLFANGYRTMQSH